MLLVIAIYGTLFLIVKCLFALYYHFKWLITEKCCLKLADKHDPDRDKRIDQFWRNEEESWAKELMEKSNVSQYVAKRKKK